MTLTVLFVDGKVTLSINFFEICVRKVFLGTVPDYTQYRELKCEDSNVLNENFVLFGHDSQIKSDSTFDLIILRAKFYIYTCKSTRTYLNCTCSNTV